MAECIPGSTTSREEIQTQLNLKARGLKEYTQLPPKKKEEKGRKGKERERKRERTRIRVTG